MAVESRRHTLGEGIAKQIDSSKCLGQWTVVNF